MTKSDKATSSSSTINSEEIQELLFVPDLLCKQNKNDRRAISDQLNELVVTELGHKIYEELKRSGAVLKAESNRGKHYFEVRRAGEKFNISPYDLAKFYLTKQLVKRIKADGKPDDYLPKIIKSCKKIMMDGLRSDDYHFRTFLEYDDELFHYGYLSRMKKVEGIAQEDIDLISKNVGEIVKNLDTLVDAKVLILRDKEGPRRLLDENLIKFIEQNASREELKFLEIKHLTLVKYATIQSDQQDLSKQKSLIIDFQEELFRQEIDKQQNEQRNEVSESIDTALSFLGLQELQQNKRNDILTQEDESFNLLNLNYKAGKENREFALLERMRQENLEKIKQEYWQKRGEALATLTELSGEVSSYELQKNEQQERDLAEGLELEERSNLVGHGAKLRLESELQPFFNQESLSRKVIESKYSDLKGDIKSSMSSGLKNLRTAETLDKKLREDFANLELLEKSSRSAIEEGVKGKKSKPIEGEKQERKAIENLQAKEGLFLAVKTGDVKDLETLINIVGDRVDLNVKDSRGRTILQIASAAGQLDMVNFLLAKSREYKLDINNTDNQGLSALHLASYAGHEEIVDELLKNGLTDKEISGSKLTALHIAAANGYVEVINSLKESGKKFDINKQDKDKNTALHLAARKGHLDVVKALIEMGAKVDIRNSDGSTPMHFAIYSSEPGSVIELLLNARADPNITKLNNSKTPLQVAAFTGKVEAVKALLKSDRIQVNNVDNSGNSALDLSLSFIRNSPEVALALLEDDRVEISQKNNQLFPRGTILHEACSKKGFEEVVAKMLERDIAFDSFNKYGKTPLHLAAEYKNNPAVLALLKKGADINKVINNEPGYNALYIAVCYSNNDNAAVVKNLLNFARQKPTNINFDKPDKDYGYTPLCLALERGEEEIANELLAFEQNGQRADIRKKNHEGCNALHLAVSSGNLNLVKKVLSFNDNHPSIDIDDFNYVTKRTALHLAAKEGKLDILKTLLEAGADINKVHPDFGTATIHYAVLSGNVDLVTYLLDERGLDVNQLVAGDNSTALHIACVSGDKEMVEFLLARPDIIVNKQDDNGFAPLHSVIDSKEITPELSKDRLEVVKALMKKEGIDLNPVNKEGLTPLHLAVQRGMVTIVAALCQARADLFKTNNDNQTPLDFARNLAKDFEQQSKKSKGKIDSIKVGNLEVKGGAIELMIRMLKPRTEQSDTPDTKKVSVQEAKALSVNKKEGKGV